MLKGFSGFSYSPSQSLRHYRLLTYCPSVSSTRLDDSVVRHNLNDLMIWWSDPIHFWKEHNSTFVVPPPWEHVGVHMPKSGTGLLQACIPPSPPIDIFWAVMIDDCLEDKREDYQNCSVTLLYCVPQFYTVISTHIWAVLTSVLATRVSSVFVCVLLN